MDTARIGGGGLVRQVISALTPKSYVCARISDAIPVTWVGKRNCSYLIPGLIQEKLFSKEMGGRNLFALFKPAGKIGRMFVTELNGNFLYRLSFQEQAFGQEDSPVIQPLLRRSAGITVELPGKMSTRDVAEICHLAGRVT